MLADHLKKHGKYPEKVSFVIWGDETMRHEGVLESQIFYLLGTKPVWDDRGKVVDVEVIPRAQLGRPRVDIVIASAAEGMFNNVTVLMDKAVQKVKAIDEAENYVRSALPEDQGDARSSAATTEDEADRRAGVRIFDEPPGTFNLNTSTIAAASGTWDSDKGMADDYHPQARTRLRQRLLGRDDGRCLPAGAVGHREDRPQQLDDAVRRAR